MVGAEGKRRGAEGSMGGQRAKGGAKGGAKVGGKGKRGANGQSRGDKGGLSHHFWGPSLSLGSSISIIGVPLIIEVFACPY